MEYPTLIFNVHESGFHSIPSPLRMCITVNYSELQYTAVNNSELQ